MDDAQLVIAARAGDTVALVAIYDRYADQIHDFSTATVRNRADAAAVTQETFLVAFERLDQLGEPARLRPWLYAIAHHAALERIGARNQRSRPGRLDEELTSPGWPEERVTRAELAEFVWMAAALLSDDDRALLDLHLRQGLEGRDLADAVGLTSAHLPVVLDRLRAQAERSLGALLVARTSRRTCPQLAQILDRSPGQLTPQLWDRITPHVDDCEICNSRRRISLSPLDLLAAATLVPAPASLRRVVLGQAELAAGSSAGSALATSSGWLFTRDGFPYRRPGGDPLVNVPTGPNPADPGTATAVPATAVPATAVPATAVPATSVQPQNPTVPPTIVTPATRSYSVSSTTTYRPPPPMPGPSERRDPDRRGIIIGALAGLIILIGAITALVATRNSGSSKPLSVNGSSTTTTGAPVPASIAPTTAAASTTTGVSTTVAVGPGRLVVGAAGIDFGVTGASQSLVVGNNGGSRLTFNATPSSPQLTITPGAGSIDIGMSQTLSVNFDRTGAPTGTFAGTIIVASEGGSATVSVSAVIDPGPTVAGEVATPPGPIFRAPCLLGGSSAPATTTITATVTGPVGLSTVLLHWQAPTGVSGTATMTGRGSGYAATLGPFATSWTIQWWVTAADASGLTTTSSHHTIMVATC